MPRLTPLVVLLTMAALTLAQTTRPALDGATVTVMENGIPRTYQLKPVAPAPLPKKPVKTPPTPASEPTGEDPDPAAQNITLTQHGAAVFVHAINGKTDPLTTRYTWTFGDGTTLPGFSAAHHYDAPGTYDITLTRTIGKIVTTEKRTVTIAPDTRRTLHVSPAGDDANDGTIDRPLRTLAQAGAIASSDVRILLKRGEQFDVDRTPLRPGKNVLLSVYGDASQPRPIVRYNGASTGEPIVRCDEKSENVVIEQITFDSANTTDFNKTSTCTPLLAAGRGIAMRHCTLLNVNYGVNANGRPQGLLIEHCDAPLDTGIRSYFAWVQGSDIAILNSTVANCTREHGIRGWEFTRLLIHGNTIANLDRTKLGDPIDIAKNTINLQAGEYAYVSGNTLRGPSSIGPLGKKDGLKYKHQRSRVYVVENNRFERAGLNLQHGLSDVLLRGNTFAVNDTRAIAIDGYDAEYGRGLANVTLDSNTATNTGTVGGFLYVGGKVGGIVCTANRYNGDRVQPGSHESAVIYVNDRDCSSFTRIAGNVWNIGQPKRYADGGVMYVWPKWSDPKGYLDPLEWAKVPQVKGDVIRIVPTQ